MEWTAKLGNGISTPAREAAADLRALRSELVDTKGVLDAFAEARGAGAGAAFTSATAEFKESPWAKYAERIKKGGAEAQKATDEAAGKVADATKKGAAGAKKGGNALSQLGTDATAAAGGLLRYAAGFAGIAGVAGLAKLAIGYRGMFRLQAIAARTQLELRALFKGVDSRPLEHALTRFARNFSVTTVSGQAFGGIVTRAFNGIFSAVERAEPLITSMWRGALLGALKLEGAYLRARIALFPYTAAIARAAGGTTGLAVAAKIAEVALVALVARGLAGIAVRGVQAGVGAVRAAAGIVRMGAGATTALGPVAALTFALTAAYLAYDQFTKLQKEWDENSWSQIKKKVKQDLGITSSDEAEKDIGARARAAYEKAEADRRAAAAAPKGTKGAQGAAAAAGGDFAAGMVKGMDGAQGAVYAAGKRMAKAAEKGVRDASETHSPSRVFERVGRDQAAGEAQGLQKGGADVQRAAERALVPSVPALPRGASGGAAGGGLVIQQLTFAPVIQGRQGDDVVKQLQDAVPMLADLVMHEIALRLGHPTT